MVDLFEDFFHALGPHKRLGIFVVNFDVRFDGFDQVFDAFKHPATDAFAGNFTEPPLDQIEPRGTGRDKVQMKSFVLLDPSLNFWVLMRGIVIDDQM